MKHKVHLTTLVKFIIESEAIENRDWNTFTKSYKNDLINEYLRFLSLDSVQVEDLQKFVRLTADAPLRESTAVPNVQVHDHVCPPSGPWIRESLNTLLDTIMSPVNTHLEYLRLHPFVDGNGRSGRVFLFWHVLQTDDAAWFLKALESLSFLQVWYYMTLMDNDRKAKGGYEGRSFAF